MSAGQPFVLILMLSSILKVLILFFAWAFPLLMIIHCLFRSGKTVIFKLLWLLVMVLGFPQGSYLYGVFAYGSLFVATLASIVIITSLVLVFFVGSRLKENSDIRLNYAQVLVPRPMMWVRYLSVERIEDPLERQLARLKFIKDWFADVSQTDSKPSVTQEVRVDGGNVIETKRVHQQIYLESQLIAAVQKGDEKEVESLLDKGADINTKSEFGYTPLMEAAQYGYFDLVKLLIGRGVDINARNERGQTALDLAEKNQREQIAEYLRRADH